jgi:hypothetical protein
VRAANPKPTKGTNVKTKSKKQSKKPKSEPSPKHKRATHPSRPVGANREELEVQLSPQEEDTYMVRLRATSERAANDVRNATGESFDDEYN